MASDFTTGSETKMGSRLQRLNGWRRLWLVATAALASATLSVPEARRTLMRRHLNDIVLLIALIAFFTTMLVILTGPIATAVEAIWFPKPALVHPQEQPHEQ
jgi:hypothetical protein